jgi:hypothetical protein
MNPGAANKENERDLGDIPSPSTKASALLTLSTLFFMVALAAALLTLAAMMGENSTSAQSRGSRPGDAQAPPLYLGIDSYRHWDKLSYLDVGDRIWGQSTADPAGTNADNTHIMRILQDGEHVLFDQVGPGVMTWIRNQQDYGGPWKLRLDGALVATVAASDMGQLNPTIFPATAMPYPLSMNMDETQGSSIVAATIPYAQSMSWSSVNPNGNFYSIYHKLPYGYPVTTWTGSEPISDVVQLIRQAGADIAPTDIYSRSGVADIPPGETDLLSLTGPTQIRAIKFRVPFAEKVHFGNTRLHIYWNGENSPSVDAPVKFMAGDGAGVYQPANRPLVRGWIAGAGGDGSTYMDFNLYWPMPFTGTARIAISSDLPSTIAGVAWSVRYEDFNDPPGWWGTFHATYTSVPNPVHGVDMTFLDVTGSGKVVGTIVNFTAPDGTLEGDPHFFIDDNNTPQVQVTGTEEWGTGGNYWDGGNQTSLPVGGLPSSINNPPGTDVDGAALYRFLVSDGIPFNRHIVLRWEHGPVDDVDDHPYRATVLWYGTPTQTALLTDDFVIGDPASRTAHNYQSPAATYYTLTAAYEYPVHNPLTTATGISTTGVSTFTMALDPRNVGAFLRRQFDYASPNQRALVFVDGQPAGTWYTGGYFDGYDIDGHVRRWREEELPLPPALTAGKSIITLRVEFLPTADPPDINWTEFRYQLYSFVMPPGSEPPSPTPTLSPTISPSPTGTSTCTPAPMASATATHTLTATPGPSATRTNSPTPTSLATPVSSPTPTSAFSQTPIPSDTPTTSATQTLTAAPSPTCTRTNTATATPAAGSTTIPSATPTSTSLPAISPSPTTTPSVCAISFADVPLGSTFYPYVRCLACLSIVNGYPDGTFRPNNQVTRGQLSKIVSNSAGFSDPQPNEIFQDVPPGSTFQVFIGRLASRGYISGYPCGGAGEPCRPGNLPYFRPNNNATRGEISKIVSNAAGFNDPPNGQQFEDVPAGSAFYTYTSRLASRGVMSGYPCGGVGEPCVPPANLPYFRPNRVATRGQAAKMVSLTFYPNCAPTNKP